MVKGNSGEPLSLPPYGYRLDTENPKRWIIDDEPAAVVRRIYEMTLDGKGTDQIATALTEEKILSPIFYWKSKGVNRPGRVNDRDPHFWNGSTVNKILSMPEYCGDVINFKTYSKSFKLKKRIPNSEENMAVFKDVHEPVIERGTWEKIQERRSNKRKRKAKDGEKNMFSGLLFCADCGKNLWFHFNQKNPDIKYFNCSGYNTRYGDCPTTHYIRVDFLEEVLLQEIRRLTRYARQHEAEFAELVMGHSEYAGAAAWERKRKELTAMQSRDKELDRLFNRMYEDNVAGKIDDERFARMTNQYTTEQKALAEKITALAAYLEKYEVKAMTADVFISTVRKYTRAKKLTERMLTELVERIEVYQSEKVDGVWQQRLKIYYTCVGAIDIPDTLSLPEITMQTRRGVTVSYDPQKIAV